MQRLPDRLIMPNHEAGTARNLRRFRFAAKAITGNCHELAERRCMRTTAAEVIKTLSPGAFARVDDSGVPPRRS
jgi:hypothetical protein